MSFVSYAQNFEDVMLWRALREVGRGFYIDVGANDPCVDSVSKAFYDRGWHGINIEPLPLPWADLERERPNDLNLQCAAGEFCGEMDLWEPEVRGWASVAPEVIAMHQKEGVQGILRKTPIRTLAEICRTHVKGEVHFLKIDVEGHERSVIAGMDFSITRPWILVVEATLPNSTIENHQDWEPLLLSNGYLPVYADGLNRFYLASEKEALKERFRYPPNVFDRFVLDYRHVMVEAWLRQTEERTQLAEEGARRAEEGARKAEERAWQAEVRARQAQELAQELTRAIEAAETQIRHSEEAARQAQAQVQAVHASTSWRITRPLRGVMRLLRGDFSPLIVVGAAIRRRLLGYPRIVHGGRDAEHSLSPWAGRIHKALELGAEQHKEKR